jgi:hypothetical protein
MTHPAPPIAAGQRRTSASPTVLTPVPVSESSKPADALVWPSRTHSQCAGKILTSRLEVYAASPPTKPSERYPFVRPRGAVKLECKALC